MLDARKLMCEGWGFVCATCLRLERGLNQGGTTCEAGLNDQVCGGPIVGMGFPYYEGLDRQTLARYCFRCGANATGAFNTPDGLIGVCDRHRDDVDGENRLVPVEVSGQTEVF